MYLHRRVCRHMCTQSHLCTHRQTRTRAHRQACRCTARTHIRTTNMQAHTGTHMCMSHPCTHMYTYRSADAPRTHVHVQTHRHMHTHRQTHTRAYSDSCAHTCTHTCRHAHALLPSSLHMHAHMHSHAHMYVRTHTHAYRYVHTICMYMHTHQTCSQVISRAARPPCSTQPAASPRAAPQPVPPVPWASPMAQPFSAPPAAPGPHVHAACNQHTLRDPGSPVGLHRGGWKKQPGGTGATWPWGPRLAPSCSSQAGPGAQPQTHLGQRCTLESPGWLPAPLGLAGKAPSPPLPF